MTISQMSFFTYGSSEISLSDPYKTTSSNLAQRVGADILLALANISLGSLVFVLSRS